MMEPVFVIIQRHSADFGKLSKALSKTDRRIIDTGFFPQLDFTMRLGRKNSLCRAYLHGENYTLLVARVSHFLWRTTIHYDFYSSFSDKTHLVTSATDAEKGYATHSRRLYAEVDSGKKVIFDKHQGIFRYLQSRYNAHK